MIYNEFIITLKILADEAKTYDEFKDKIKESFSSLPPQSFLYEIWKDALTKHDKYIANMERKLKKGYILKRCEGCGELRLMGPNARVCSRKCAGILGMRVSGSNNAFTKPERVMMLWLLKNKLLFVPQWVDGDMRPDFFVFPNICIYVDSWHHDYRNRREDDIRIALEIERENYIVIRIEDKDLYEGYRPDWILDIAWKDNINIYQE